MSSPVIIFDLDDTLVNTSSLLSLRERKKWKDCVSHVSSTTLYPGIIVAISLLMSKGIKLGIVTRSVSFYANAILHHHKIPYDALICYHDCTKQKPAPDPILLCLNRLGGSSSNSLGIGDAGYDAMAYKSAGISAWGAGWSTVLDRTIAWDHIVLNPEKILNFFELKQ